MLYKDLKDPRLTKLKEALAETVLKSKADSKTKSTSMHSRDGGNGLRISKRLLYSPYRATNSHSICSTLEALPNQGHR